MLTGPFYTYTSFESSLQAKRLKAEQRTPVTPAARPLVALLAENSCTPELLQLL